MASTTCRVTATLVQAGGKSLGSGKITLQAGKRGKLKLTLTALARTRLKAKASIPATLVVKHADGRVFSIEGDNAPGPAAPDQPAPGPVPR